MTQIQENLLIIAAFFTVLNIIGFTLIWVQNRRNAQRPENCSHCGPQAALLKDPHRKQDRGATMKAPRYALEPYPDNSNIVVVHRPDGWAWCIARDEADPEHRLVEYRLAAAWFGNTPGQAHTDSPDDQKDKRPMTMNTRIKTLDVLKALPRDLVASMTQNDDTPETLVRLGSGGDFQHVAQVFETMLCLADDVVQAYRSDLYYDALALNSMHWEPGFSFLYSVRETGTVLNEVPESAHDADLLSRTHLSRTHLTYDVTLLHERGVWTLRVCRLS